VAPLSRPDDPQLPDDVTGRELDRDVLRELETLHPGTSALVARHLVMAGRLLDSEPDLAYAHATAARRLASRLASTREAAGLSAYVIGRYSEALAQLRAARRISGSAEHLPVMADCERGLGRPDRALATAADPAVAQLDRAGQVEMRIVAAGARRDMGQLDAAVVTLQGPDLSSSSSQPWTLRLWYAYADALSAAGRPDEAREWFARVVERDGDGGTDAELRLAEIDGIVFTDALGDDARKPRTRRAGPATSPATALPWRSPGTSQPRYRPSASTTVASRTSRPAEVWSAGHRPQVRPPLLKLPPALHRRVIAPVAPAPVRHAPSLDGFGRGVLMGQTDAVRKAAEAVACNEVRLVGRLAAAAQEKELPSGDLLMTFRLVVDRPPAQRRERSPTVDTIDCSAWRADVRRSVGVGQAGRRPRGERGVAAPVLARSHRCGEPQRGRSRLGAAPRECGRAQ
jgi:hypothetical protein